MKLSQDLRGNLLIDGKRASELINGIFRMTTDSLEGWRSDARQRFADSMADNGRAREAAAILKAAR